MPQSMIFIMQDHERNNAPARPSVSNGPAGLPASQFSAGPLQDYTFHTFPFQIYKKSKLIQSQTFLLSMLRAIGVLRLFS